MIAPGEGGVVASPGWDRGRRAQRRKLRRDHASVWGTRDGPIIFGA